MSRNIQDLYHPIIPVVEKLLSEIQQVVCTNGLLVFLSHTYRTIAEQNELYSHGRNGDKRTVVTNARGGYSFHNYCLAVDIAFLRPNNTLDWDNALFVKSGVIGQNLGFTWGGEWGDYPHFQYDGGLTILDVKNGKRPLVGKYDYEFAKKHSGKIFLQVEANGEAWYINPKTLKAEYMGKTPKDMLTYVKSVGIGLTNANLDKLK